MSDEVIQIQFVADTQQAIKNAQAFEQQIAATKAQLIDLAQQTSASMASIAKSMKAQKWNELMKEFSVKKTGAMGDILVDKDAIAAARVAYREYAASITVSLQQISATEKQISQDRIAFEKGLQGTLSTIEQQRTEESMRLSKQRAAIDKQSAQQILTQQKAAAAEQEAFERKLASTLKSIEQDAAKESERLTKQKATALKQEAKEVLASTQGTTGLAGAFNKLGSVGKYVFGTVLGITAVGAIRSIAQEMLQAVKAGEEYVQSLYKLETSVHALQRVGYDVTIQDTIDLIEELSEKFGTFSQKQIVDGVGYVQLLTRNFGFTNEQMKQTFEIASTLSIVLGKDFNEAARETALFLSSGYAESMQKAGLAVNRLTVSQEAQRMGIDKSYTALTEQERSMAALSLVYREIGPLMGDVARYQDTELGQIKDLTTDYEDLSNAMSTRLIPIKLAFLKAVTKVIDVLMILNNTASQIAGDLAYYLAYPFITAIGVYAAWQAKLDGVDVSMKDVLASIEKEATDFGKRIQDGLNVIKPLDLSKAGMKDAPKSEWGSMPLLSGEDADKQTKIIEDMYKDAAKLQRDYEKDFAEAGRELTEDVGLIDLNSLDQIVNTWSGYFDSVSTMSVDETEQMQTYWEQAFGEFGSIVNDGLDKAFDIWQDYYNKLEDIARDEQQDIVDENIDYAQAIEDANRDAQQSIEDANRKHREEELKAEREYQEKLRRLREEYLFDLEDALRERDALQVIRLMRKYAMDKANLEREKDIEDEQRDEDFRREIEDIRRQRERKLQELAIEHQRRLEEIRIQVEREREEAARNRDQAMEELKTDLENERTERQQKYEQELQDLKDRFAERLTEIFIGLTDEEGMTAEMLDTIGKLYLDMFGKDGVVDMSYESLRVMIANSVSQAQTALIQLQELAVQAQETASAIAAQAAQAAATAAQIAQTAALGVAGAQGNMNPYAGGWSPQAVGGHALGGTEYANTPTVALFGEAGPEIASFTPISRLNTNNLGLPNAFYGDTGISGNTSNAKVLIHLGPGLIGEIVDQSMNGFAQIIEER